MRNILRGLVKMADFDGRDTRKQFWHFALVVIVLYHLAFYAVFAAASSAICLDQPVFNELQKTCGNVAEIGQKMVAMMSWLWVLAMAFLAAAVTRRLHNTGKSGKLALLFAGVISVHLLAANISVLPALFSNILGNQIYLWVTGPVKLYELIMQIVIIVEMCRDGSIDDNRYGSATSPLDIGQTLASLRA
jgi:uncharacterized membrane protein YhaH (DUF805 family)